MNNILAAAVLLFGSLSVGAQSLRTVPLFRHAIIADAVGSANLVTADVDGDGKAEAVSCSNGAPFAVGIRDGAFATKWHGADEGCVAVTAGDRNADGAVEVIAVTAKPSGYQLVVYDPRTLAGAAASVAVPDYPADVAMGNVDLDAGNEIVVVTSNATYVYDGPTLALDWTATGYGGTAAAIADVDGNAQLEIVVNGPTGSVLDAAAQTSKWGYLGGFGSVMAVGNLDGDTRAEIAFTRGWSTSITILNGDTGASTTVTAPDFMDSLGVGDANGDGANEILVGNNQWGFVSGLRPGDGFVLWSVTNPEHGTTAVTAGDVDGDGVSEVLWGAGLSSSGDDALFIADGVTGTIEYRSEDLDGQFMSATGDLDGNGRFEIVVASRASRSGYSGGEIEIFDATTGTSRGRLNMGMQGELEISRIAIGQLDADAQLEIVALGSNWYDPTLASWDSGSRTLEWSVTTNSSSGAKFLQTALVVENVDGDSVDEIIVGMSDEKIAVLNGASPIIQKSLVVPGAVSDFVVTDIDSDWIDDLVVLTDNATVSLFETATWSSLGEFAAPGYKVAATPASGGTIAVANTNSLALFAYPSFTERWSCSTISQDTRALHFGAVDGVTRLFAGTTSGVARVYPLTGASCPEPETLTVATGWIWDVHVVDATGDGRTDLVVDTWGSSEVHLLGLADETTGDVTGDDAVTLEDVDAITDFVLHESPGLAPSGDANDDRRVSVEDAFTLLHEMYGIAPQGAVAAADTLSLGSVTAAPFSRVTIPVYLRDVAPAGNIRSIALRVYTSTAAWDVSFNRAGALAGLTPLYERVSATDNSVGYVATFADPLALASTAPGSRIGTIEFDIPALAAGSTVRVSFDAAATAASSQTQYNRKLQLLPGTVTVGGTATAISLTSSANPSSLGQSVTFTATVSPSTTGSVAFYDGATLLGHVALSTGSASLTTSSLTQGSHAIKATFEGSLTHQSSSATISQAVEAPPIGAPANVTATATSANTVTVTWSAVANAASYEVYRSVDGGGFVAAGSGPGTTFNDAPLAAGKTYLYKIRAIATGGASSPYSALDAATTIVFEDEPLGPGMAVKLAHLSQLRTAVNAMRASAGLAAATFTDPTPSSATPVRVLHVQQLRNALQTARAQLGLSPIDFAEDTLTAGATQIRAGHFQELRTGVR